MSSNKMGVCKHCGAEIAVSAKSCPQCGGKNKKPIYKRGWFIALCVIVVIGVVGTAGGNGTEEGREKPVGPSVSAAVSQGNVSVEQEPEIEYVAYTVDTMMDDLNGNALKASQKYDKQYVEVKGRLSNIDSSGSYINLLPISDEWAFIGVQCYIKNDEQKQQVMEMSIDDVVTVKGKIVSVGEVLGYSLNIDEIVE